MADDKENKQTFSIGAFDLPTAEKYVRFLDKHTSFGGHTGLPKEMRNKNPNHSLDFSLGIYQTVDVYAIPPNKCVIGSVVNFVIDNDYNPEGVTYAYPCNNTDAPMGYMISNASSEVIGICVVHGVLEVPLVYPKNTPHSEVEKKDYVQYNIEEEAFEFADSGYPVFNVYQDADGDWIAIILFGNDNKEGAVYDGPFATTIAGVTGSTMYVNVAEGDIVDKHYRYTCPEIVYGDEDLTDDICLNTGETLWLGVYGATITGSSSTLTQGNYAENTEELSDLDLIVNVVGSTYTFFASSGTPIDLTGTTSFYRIAENVDGKLRQLQYGDIVIDGTKDNHIPPYHALGVSGVSPDGLGHTFILPVKGGTVGFWDEGGGAVGVWTNNDGTSTHVLVNKIPYTATEDGWIRISVIDDGTSDGECLSFFSATGGVPLYKYCAVSGGTGGSGGGGGIGFPDYSLLGGSTISISGTTGYTGVGVTYLIPVPGGVAIEYETEAPECIDVARFASFLDSANSVSHDLVVDTPWQTPSDGGWVRISVLDNGLHREGCLRFFVDGVDWSNALPLYRYGDYRGTTPPPAYSYTGSFAVNTSTISGTTAGQPVVVDGSTIGTATGSTTNYVTIYDTNNRDIYNQYSGQVHIGEQSYKAPFYRSIFESGESIYLVGTFDSDNPSFITNLEFRRVSGYAPTGIQDNQFYARICYSVDGKMYQTQYGDIVQPLKTHSLSCSVSGSTEASIYITGSTVPVKLKSANSNLTFSSSSNTITLTVSNGSSGGGDFGYPDYSTLGSYSSVVPDSQGITFLLPVKKNHNITYYTDASATVIARYAPNEGSDEGSAFDLTKGTAQPAGADGWVKISVFDDGTNFGKCLRFVDNYHEFPLYKFGAGSGGSGGGGGVDAPDWGRANHTQIINVGDSYTTSSAGWVYACAVVPRAAKAHLMINGEYFKVADSYSSDSGCGGSICIPVRAGTTISWDSQGATEAWAAFYSTGGGGYS